MDPDGIFVGNGVAQMVQLTPMDYLLTLQGPCITFGARKGSGN